MLSPHEEPASADTLEMDSADRPVINPVEHCQDTADIGIEVLLSFPELLRISAHEYADRGWPVFPLAAGTKLPLAGSRGFLDATLDHAQIAAWWDECSTANIGIATGFRSRLWVLDVDVKHGGDRTLAALEAEQGSLETRSRVVTPSGGWHVYCNRPDGPDGFWPSSIGYEDKHGRLHGIGVGLDVRADGGYVVAPPSVIDQEGQYVEVES